MARSALERRFRVWDYNVSHKQMLIRSPHGADDPMNFDILFFGVEYVDLASTMKGVSFDQPTDRDYEAVAQRMGKSVQIPKKLFVIVSSGIRYYVVAAYMNVQENQLDFMESSLEYFGDPQ